MDAQYRLRLIVDPPREGPWNMAADEWLLHATSETGGGCLRLYRWEPATLSLGYFQSAEELSAHPLGNALPVVRRLSGGGAIVHHHEWTYALTLPIEHPLAQDRLALYGGVHRTLVKLLTNLGLSARIFQSQDSQSEGAACGSLAEGPRERPDGRGTAPASSGDRGVGRTRGKCPFLCFLRRSPGDILVKSADGAFETKIVGSAQRRERGAVLQHGSILFAQSPFTPELPGLRELCVNGRDGTPAGMKANPGAGTPQGAPAAELLVHWERDFPGQWVPLLEEGLGCRWEPIDWSRDEVAAIDGVKSKYEDAAWNRHRRRKTS
ncbi:MAG: hypothetical protein Kow0040_13110 [Thermogutta sp.]